MVTTHRTSENDGHYHIWHEGGSSTGIDIYDDDGGGIAPRGVAHAHQYREADDSTATSMSRYIHTHTMREHDMTPTPTYEKHTTHTDALDTLGTLITRDEKRDAVHLAVFPIEAGAYLIPGEHVFIDDEGKARSCNDNDEWDRAVGIVDPFLEQGRGVDPGDWLWLMVYPRQITSLHHVWEHPAFPASTVASTAVPAAVAEEWLRDFAAKTEVPSFESMVEVTAMSARRGDDWVTFGEDAYGSIPAEYWDHLEAYLGEKFPVGERPEHFSCAC